MAFIRRLVWRLRVALIGTLTAGLVFVVADSLLRPSFARPGLGAHVAAALGLYGAAAAALGVAAWLALGVAGGLASLIRRRSPRGARQLARVGYGVLGALAMWPGISGALGGRAAARTGLGWTLPLVITASVGLGVASGAFLFEHAITAVRVGRARSSWRVVGLFVVSALVLIGLDSTQYVGLYARLHTLLELAAAWLLSAAAGLMWLVVSGDVLHGAPGTRRRSALVHGVSVVCVAAIAFATAFARSPSLRHWHEAALRGASREPVYLGRLLRRMNRLESMAQPSHSQPRARIDELAEAYDIAETTPDPLWDGAVRREASSSARRLSPPDARGYNVLVYYVDTLRSDVAFDGAIMPNVERFARDSLVFQRAYSPGSDTRRALPGLVTGRYGASWNRETSLLTRAKTLGLPTTLFIGESAFEFLSKLVSDFSFDDTFRFPDYAQGGVWGYGAHQPTAGRIVDHAIEWLSQRGPSPFFVWLFNFDVHAWRELDRDYVYSAADRYQVPDEGPYNWRYRVVARSVDAEFGRLMTALEDLGLADRTIVLFVSDHGEGLGYRDFWVHSTFLWEPLVRVPLVLRVPGVAPATTDRLVSLVDVSPTLARLLDPKALQADYHGEDLLSVGLAPSTKRRFPVLLAAASDEAKTRVGIVGESYKLVLPTEWGEPELYDLRAPDPDAKDVAQEHPGQLIKLLGPLLRSPVLVEP